MMVKHDQRQGEICLDCGGGAGKPEYDQRQEKLSPIMAEGQRMMGRYQRQEKLAQIGAEGQKKLAEASVTVIGAGGLGSPVLTYLAEAGVGRLRLIDFDTVGITNLNRQFLYTEKDLGRKKADAAKERLELLNSEILVEALDARLTEDNAEELIGKADVVVSCLDSISARLIVNEVCVRRGIPLVEGGISGFFGFVMCVGGDGPCLECLGYNRSMDQKNIPALGAVAGVIGSLQAAECLKILLGAGEPLYGRMIQYDGINGSFDEIVVKKNENCGLHERCGQS